MTSRKSWGRKLDSFPNQGIGLVSTDSRFFFLRENFFTLIVWPAIIKCVNPISVVSSVFTIVQK